MFEHEHRKIRKPNNEQTEMEARCVFTKMSPSMITPRRLLAFENRTADSRLDDLSSPTSASARTLGLGFALLSLPHRDAKKTGSKKKCKVVSKDRWAKGEGVKNSCGGTYNSVASNSARHRRPVRKK